MRVVVADDLVLFRQGLVVLLRQAGIDVVGEARTGREAIARATHHGADVVIMDARMPPDQTASPLPGSGAEQGVLAALELKRESPDIGVLVLTAYPDASSAQRLLDECSGGIGYLLKDRVDDLSTLQDALERVNRSEAVVDIELVRQMINRRRREPSPLDGLDPRELTVLRLMAEGRTNASIARELSFSVKSVEVAAHGVFKKLGLRPTGDSARTSDRNPRVMAVLTWLRARRDEPPAE